MVERADILSYIEQYAEFEQHGNEFWCCSPLNPNDNDPSFSVNRENHMWYCYSTGQGGNLIEFIKLYNHTSFVGALNILATYLGVTIEHEPDTLQILREMKRFRVKPKIREPTKPHLLLPENYMDIFQHRPITEWENEFITPEIADYFEVRYAPNDNALVFPVRDLGGNIINVKGRRLGNEWKEETGKKKAKYFHYFNMQGDIDFFWGWAEATDGAFRNKIMVLVEAEKSVMQAFGYGHNNVVAMGTSHITDYQLRTLVRQQLPVVLAVDKDKMLAIRSDDNFFKLSRMIDCYTLSDSEGLLGEKDSPTDRGKEVFERLLDNKERFKWRAKCQ